MSDQHLVSFNKMLISGRYWLLGMAQTDERYRLPLEVFEVAREHHCGERNDAQPEFSHQLRIFHYLRTLHGHLSRPWVVYALGLAHDMIEDANQKTKQFVDPAMIKDRWGLQFHDKLLSLSKEILGKPNPAYSIESIFKDEDCGPAKGADRIDNLSTMIGVFKRPRAIRYITETEEKFIPNIKGARRLFPSQEGVYENMKLMMRNQLNLAKRVVELETTLDSLRGENNEGG